MMTEASERGVAFTCEVCGWHTTDRVEAVWHAMRAHSGAAGGLVWPGGVDPGQAWRDMIGGAIKASTPKERKTND